MSDIGRTEPQFIEERPRASLIFYVAIFLILSLTSFGLWRAGLSSREADRWIAWTVAVAFTLFALYVPVHLMPTGKAKALLTAVLLSPVVAILPASALAAGISGVVIGLGVVAAVQIVVWQIVAVAISMPSASSELFMYFSLTGQLCVAAYRPRWLLLPVYGMSRLMY